MTRAPAVGAGGADGRAAEASPRRRLGSIDLLRGAAAFAVLVYHIPPLGRRVHEDYALLLPLELAHHGVTLFIVISGFCIHLSAVREYDPARGFRPRWGRFWVRRMVRLYPPYLAAMALSAGAHWLVHRQLGPAPEVAADFVTHLLMAHNLTNFGFGWYNGVFWTLGLEEQLYALYFIFLRLRNRFGLRAAVAVVAAVTVGWRSGLPVASTVLAGCGVPLVDQQVRLGPVEVRVTDAAFWPFAWWLVWVFGAVAAEAHVGLVRLPAAARSLTAVVALATLGAALDPFPFLPAPDHPSALWKVARYLVAPLATLAWGAAAFALVCRLTAADRGGPAGPVERLGLVSYSLYLTHNLAIGLIDLATGGTLGLFTRYAVMAPAAILLSVGFFYLIERPFLAQSKASGRGRSTRPAGGAH